MKPLLLSALFFFLLFFLLRASALQREIKPITTPIIIIITTYIGIFYPNLFSSDNSTLRNDYAASAGPVLVLGSGGMIGSYLTQVRLPSVLK